MKKSYWRRQGSHPRLLRGVRQEEPGQQRQQSPGDAFSESSLRLKANPWTAQREEPRAKSRLFLGSLGPKLKWHPRSGEGSEVFEIRSALDDLQTKRGPFLGTLDLSSNVSALSLCEEIQFMVVTSPPCFAPCLPTGRFEPLWHVESRFNLRAA